MYWHRIAAAAAAAAADFRGGRDLPASWRQRCPDFFVSTLFESCEPYTWYSTVGWEDSQHRLSKFSSFSRNDERFKVHRLCNLVLSNHMATDVSSHSTSASRANLHLTRHHPIHAQNFTIWSHYTARVPCSCLGSTCSNVSSRPPCFEFFVMEGHISTISQFKS